MHKDSAQEVIGTLRAHEDWGKYIYMLGMYKRGLGDRYYFMIVLIFECLSRNLSLHIMQMSVLSYTMIL
jgi:hypothetical protein